MHFEICQPLGNRIAAARQERRPHTVRNIPQSQVQTGWLDLSLGHRFAYRDTPIGQHLPDSLAGKDTLLGSSHFIILKNKKRQRERQRFENGRASEIRTHDLPSPRRTRYQTAP